MSYYRCDSRGRMVARVMPSGGGLGFSLKPPKWIRKAQPGKILKKIALPVAAVGAALLIPGVAPAALAVLKGGAGLAARGLTAAKGAFTGGALRKGALAAGKFGVQQAGGVAIGRMFAPKGPRDLGPAVIAPEPVEALAPAPVAATNFYDPGQYQPPPFQAGGGGGGGGGALQAPAESEAGAAPSAAAPAQAGLPAPVMIGALVLGALLLSRGKRR